MYNLKCRFCGAPLEDTVIDLGTTPIANAFVKPADFMKMEPFFALHAFVCGECFLVLLPDMEAREHIFNDEYAYFSSYSQSVLDHARDYVEMMTERFGYNEDSLVIEVASNDGYLLQYFKEKNIPVMGIEPTANTAQVSMEKGIKTVIEFFGSELADRFANTWDVKADLLLGNNVLAHVPDIVDFVKGMKIILKDTGVVTMEFPHLMQLVDNNQFDTIYHEHFSYLSLYTVQQIFAAQGLELFDVDELPTHGGSLRIYARHQEDASKPVSPNIAAVLKKEMDKGMNGLAYYDHFQQKALKVKLDLYEFLIDQKRAGKQVAGYGAAAKGNTLMNYCGIKNDLVSFVVDANPHKQNKFLPASHIPVYDEQHLKDARPDYVIILPWNLKDEIMGQLAYIREWGGRFVIPIPELQLL